MVTAAVISTLPVLCERHGVVVSVPDTACWACMISGWGVRTRSALVRDVGEQVKLRLDFMADGERPPEPGDELRTLGGRRYLVTAFKGKTITVVILPADAPPTPGRLLRWWWSARKRRA